MNCHAIIYSIYPLLIDNPFLLFETVILAWNPVSLNTLENLAAYHCDATDHFTGKTG